MKINKMQLIEQEGLKGLPEQSALKILGARYIIIELGMGQLEVEERKKMEDFDWDYLQPLDEVRKHLGKQWKQKLDEAFDWKICKTDDDPNDYIDAEPKIIIADDTKHYKKIEETTSIIEKNGRKYEVIKESKITIRRIEDIEEAFKLEGNYNISRVNNRYLQEGLRAMCDRLNKPNIGSNLYMIISALSEIMSMNNFIDETISAKWLDTHCPLVGKRFIDHEKPMQILIEEDIISMNDKKQIMINPLFAIAIAPKPKNLHKIQEMYLEFKQTGKCPNHFNKNHPSE